MGSPRTLTCASLARAHVRLQYSGYINVTNSKFLHYWYVESQKDPSTDPLST